MFRLIVGDVETTGATPSDKVVELAWTEIDEDLQVIDQQHSLIDPQMQISASASGVHGITNADVIDAPTIEEYFTIILGGNHFKHDDEVVLIAHNAEFDKRYLGPHMPIVRTLCTLRLARRVFTNVENHKLATLMYALGLVRGQSHSAKGDVETTLDLLRRIIAETGKSLPELSAASLEPIWVEKMPFGKHKDVPLKALPLTYISWLLALPNLDRDMIHSLNLVRSGSAP